MPYYISIILYFSIVLPVLIGCIRFRQIDATYLPFLLCLFLAFIHETASYFLIMEGYNNIPVFNVYLLLEIPVLLWLFYNWSYMQGAAILFPALAGGMVLLWLAETIAYSGLENRFLSYYIIVSSFMLVMLSINKINKLIVTEKKLLLKHPVFLLCIGFIIFFSYSILVEVFWMYGLFDDKSFEAGMQYILEFINLSVNLIFTLALLWIPSKQRFILPSS